MLQLIQRLTDQRGRSSSATPVARSALPRAVRRLIATGCASSRCTSRSSTEPHQHIEEKRSWPPKPPPADLSAIRRKRSTRRQRVAVAVAHRPQLARLRLAVVAGLTHKDRVRAGSCCGSMVVTEPIFCRWGRVLRMANRVAETCPGCDSGGASAKQLVDTGRRLGRGPVHRAADAGAGLADGPPRSGWPAYSATGARLYRWESSRSAVSRLQAKPVLIYRNRPLVHRRDFAEQLTSTELPMPSSAQLETADGQSWHGSLASRACRRRGNGGASLSRRCGRPAGAARCRQ